MNYQSFSTGEQDQDLKIHFFICYSSLTCWILPQVTIDVIPLCRSLNRTKFKEEITQLSTRKKQKSSATEVELEAYTI